MTTARTIVKKAMQKLGVLTKTEEPSADELSDGLSTLNAMLSSWSNESLFVNARVWEDFTLTAGTYEYTIGTGMTFNTARPIVIVTAFARQSTIDYAMDIIPDDVYNQFIAQKTVPGRPRFLNFDGGYPTGKIRLYPNPDTTYTLRILSEKELSSYTIDQTVQFPPGWELALQYNLAVLMAPEYGQTVTQELFTIARETKAAIKDAVARTRPITAQPGVANKYNIYTGW